MGEGLCGHLCHVDEMISKCSQYDFDVLNHAYIKRSYSELKFGEE